MDDSPSVRMREGFEHLRRDLDGAAVVEVARGECVPHRSAGDVLVGDVDVAGIAGERVDPLAARMPERRCRLRLTLGARGRLSLTGDHLQRDVEARLLVAREPDVAHPTRPKRAQRPVSAEDQLLGERGR